MRIADASRIEELAGRSNGWCVSAFLPEHDATLAPDADVLQLKNLLRTAEIELVELGVRSPEAAAMLAEAVPAELADPTSGIFHRAGVAVYAAPGMIRSYRMTTAAPELVTVAPRFHLKPLFAELAHDHRFFVLALTRGFAGLYAGDPVALHGVELADMPHSLDDAIRYDDRERALLSHSASRRGVGGVVAAFHGQGDRADHLPEDMARYLRLVDAAVTGHVGPQATVVLAGSKDVVSLYRDISSLSGIAGLDISGNPETMARADLHARAWEIVEGACHGALDPGLAEFHRLNGTGLASGIATTVIEAARAGRVKELFVAADAQLWGRSRGDGEPEIHATREPGDEDLLDTAAVEAWTKGAPVHVAPGADLEMDGDIGAVFRY